MDTLPDSLPITQAIREAKPDINLIRSMIENGVNVNESIQLDGNTPLLVAVNEGHLNVIQLLLELGADVFIRNELYEAPLDRAVRFTNENRNENGEEEIYHVIKLLLEKGANPNEPCGYENAHTQSGSRHGMQ